MMIITKKALHRRTILRGIGATVALPLLDAMVPAFAALQHAAHGPPARLSMVYVPNGIMMDKWTPATEGSGFKLMPIMEPLARFPGAHADLGGLANKGGARASRENAGDHSRARRELSLTGVHPRKTEGADTRGPAFDGPVAAEGDRPSTPSSPRSSCAIDPTTGSGLRGRLFLRLHEHDFVAHAHHAHADGDRPRASVFERLFGDGNTTDPAARLAGSKRTAAFWTSGPKKRPLQRPRRRRPRQAHRISRRHPRCRAPHPELGEANQTAELPRWSDLPAFRRRHREHAKLMLDLQVLAYQTDLTRVVTFMMGHEGSGRAYADIGVPDAHHALSHHRGDPKSIEKLAKVNAYHAKMFAYYLEKLRSTPDGDGSLLDHMMILYGAGMSDGNLHLHDGSARPAGGRTGPGQRRPVRSVSNDAPWQTCT